VPFRDLTAEIVEGHQQRCRKHVRLVLQLAILRIPADDVLIAAPNAVWVRLAVHQVMTELVREREVDAPRRSNRRVIEYAPARLAGPRTHQRPVKFRKDVAFHQRDWIVRKALPRKFERNLGDIHRKTIGTQRCVQQQGQVIGPPHGVDRLAHLSSSQTSIMRLNFSFVVGSRRRYFR
jgi:hypothetical protein